MTNRNTDSSQGDGCIPPPPAQGPPGPPEQLRSRAGNSVFKSGPLFISSKGIGWTSWKKRWFILTRTSLVFFRSDPSAIPQKGSEVNLTLGGIDLNNSGSVVIKADKKLLTVLFPDGRDGRAFTLKAETMEDLHEWKDALENALALAPSAALVMGQNGIFKNDQPDAVDGSLEELKDKQPMKSLVVGRPILLALEDIDGSPSFLEKALKFIEEHGVKVEGILRQAADVDDVELRVREYEQGKTEFSAEEDPHVVADCVKHVLRELPSSPVPASCCNALLEACRTDRGGRVTAMRTAICETFPEPNRRLLQRILIMMQNVASHKAENRMSSSAVAACMAPLLLRPLLAGDCELETDFDVGGDGSIQLLQAAAAANHAQAIVITLLEEYDKIFGLNELKCSQEGTLSPDIYSDSEESGSESEEASDDEESYETDEHDDASHDSYSTTVGDVEHASSGSGSENGDTGDDNFSDDKGFEDSSTDSKSPKANEDNQKLSPQISLLQIDNIQKGDDLPNKSINTSAERASEPDAPLGNPPAQTSSEYKLAGHIASSGVKKSTTLPSKDVRRASRPTVWGRTSAQKNLSMESIDYPFEEDEVEVQKLEVAKTDLQSRIAEEAKGNAILQESLERRKEALHSRRLALEQDVARLQEELQRERDLRTTLEAGLEMPRGPITFPATIDEKTKADLEEIALAESEVANLKQKADDLGRQLNQQREQNHGSGNDLVHQPQHTPIHQKKLKNKQETETMATSHLSHRSTRSKDNHGDGADPENESIQGTPTLPNKHPPQSQQQDQARNSNSRSAEALDVSSSAESAAARLTSSINSKKAGARGEMSEVKIVVSLANEPDLSKVQDHLQGANTTTSALTKLTTRLNFLKERRTQIANELQNFDKGRGSGKHAYDQETGNGLEHRQSFLNLDKDKGQGPETQSFQNPEKKEEPGSCQPCQNLDKGVAKEDQSVKNPENIRKQDGKSSVRVLDRGRRSEGESVHNQDRVKSEGQSHIPPRTNSR